MNPQTERHIEEIHQQGRAGQAAHIRKSHHKTYGPEWRAWITDGFGYEFRAWHKAIHQTEKGLTQ